jgi:hypothetical protein
MTQIVAALSLNLGARRRRQRPARMPQMPYSVRLWGQKAFTVNKRKLREGTLPSYFAIAAAHKARTRKLESAIPESTAKNAVRS